MINNNFDNEESTKDYVTNMVIYFDEAQDDQDEKKSIIRELQDRHWESGSSETDQSYITDILEDLINKEMVSLSATIATIYGGVAPISFITYLSRKISEENLYKSEVLAKYQKGVELATENLQEIYYGSTCPGMLENLHGNEAALKEEFENMRSLLEPIIIAYSTQTSAQALMNILKNLKPADE